jgi:hypothetical protein
MYALRIVLLQDHLYIRHQLCLHHYNVLYGDYPDYHPYNYLDRGRHQETIEGLCHFYRHLLSCLCKSSHRDICTLLFHAYNPSTSCPHICPHQAN